MARQKQMIKRRAWPVTLASVAIGLATMSTATATGYGDVDDAGPQIVATPASITCGSSTFMATNLGATSDPHTCGQALTIAGTSFFNRIETKLITSVKLYWLDEPFVGLVAGARTFVTERAAATACEDYGVLLGEVSVTSESFSYPVASANMPPHARSTTNGTLRIGANPSVGTNDGQFWYGTNGICAVWDHASGGLTHKSSAGIATVVIKPV